MAHVFLYISPLDIVAARKYLAVATNQRNVWTNALRIVCHSNGMFLPSFPMETMALKALEHAALAPYRFPCLEMNDDNWIPPLSTRLLRDIRPDFGHFKGLFLVPGGRFLVTRTSSSTSIWDLGASSYSFISLGSLASLNGSYDMFDCLPTQDGTGLLLFLGLSVDEAAPHPKYSEISVYRIYPASLSPNFDQLACLKGVEEEELLHLRCISCTQDLVVFMFNNAFVVFWDFKIDAVAYGPDFDHDPEGESLSCYSEVLIFNKLVLLFESDGFCLLRIPDLIERDETVSLSENWSNAGGHRLIPIMDFRHPFRHSYSDHDIYIPSRSWLPDTLRNQLFWVVARESDSDSLICNTYTALHVSQLGLNCVPAATSSLKTQELITCSGTPELRICGGEASLSFYGGEDLQWGDHPQADPLRFGDFGIMILSWEVLDQPFDWSERSDEEVSEYAIKCIWKDIGAGNRSSHLASSSCPASGRLCLLKKDSYEIHVYDYLSPFTKASNVL
ncbi:hypothetical protein DXG01_005835 [Tephrocybe rancida]|nr:hypothetical protein DXG01_005835 [Tephrocybe rancida]